MHYLEKFRDWDRLEFHEKSVMTTVVTVVELSVIFMNAQVYIKTALI